MVVENYVCNRVGIRCSLAEDEYGNLLGLESLVCSTEDRVMESLSRGHRRDARIAGRRSNPLSAEAVRSFRQA
ncbi:hypothetical protein AGR4A_pAt10095 [Agrobacterium tumefaciens str. B6]|uniref:Uncharacterized protein n=1 Tax=Agrobacterium tumefaciens str. B6 TaxID=1183423 RepID=A0A822VA23_AGRTU|nr:hypothetical protein AGR4A_pAt10095 [Agrobacterium tumefaciens str. B6]